MIKRWSVLAYGLSAYATFLGVFVYAVGFLGNVGVPRSIDSAARGSFGSALMIDVLLLGVFAVQHSVMARPAFKRWWTRFVPEPIERSTYVLFANLAMILLFWQWRPMGGMVWDVAHSGIRAALYVLFAGGWLLVLTSTFLINHFDLFGLRQTWSYFRGRECRPLRFATPGLYRMVRHPLYVGWITVFWAAPTMTAAHLLFAVGTTAYILIAIVFEERDLLRFHGADYRRYRAEVPMLIPRFGRRTRTTPVSNETTPEPIRT